MNLLPVVTLGNPLSRHQIKNIFCPKDSQLAAIINEPLSFLMTNSHSRGPISVTTCVNIRYTLKSNIQHIILLGVDSEENFSGVEEHRGRAHKQKRGTGGVLA